MKLLLKAMLFIAIPFQLVAQNPELTSLSPSKFLTQSEPTIMRLTINGKNMWPNYLTISMAIDVMHIHFKRDGRDEVIRGSGISSVSQSLSFPSTGWVDKPGQIEVYITIDAFGGRPAYRSNSLFITVEPTATTAPVLNSLSNSSFKTGSPKEKYYIRLYGKNFGEIRSTSVSIGGINAGIGWSNLTDGVIDVWVPADVYSKAGEYPVQVKSKYGLSNTLPLKIESVATLVRAVPIGVKPVTAKPVIQTKTAANTKAISTRLATLNTDNAARLNTEMIRGARVTITGVITDPALGATLEDYILNLENVFVVDNQLAIADSPGNININLKAMGIDAAAVEGIKKKIREKAAELKLTVSVGG